MPKDMPEITYQKVYLIHCVLNYCPHLFYEHMKNNQQPKVLLILFKDMFCPVCQSHQ